ncbi:hypothetical protein K493DRAFT_75535 [Basidiobolus meristosporus CBS 931.73]|uniref:Uncharacterized protein n=1 Tax=Basidiobolus meristosporus CBS 931.73 TaxID=1314790 RepID=A0A1Y1XTB1_9FUNG|nr:hypothetical protein K493DRAFT_75535 [Basidiobolus meristosporus CBS 931.73]|eukprot:ORX88746.1 hypothetical protein K493DRAFT_75535 [Basidiobolus meristosporus CBS 931.73]
MASDDEPLKLIRVGFAELHLDLWRQWTISAVVCLVGLVMAPLIPELICDPAFPMFSCRTQHESPPGLPIGKRATLKQPIWFLQAHEMGLFQYVSRSKRRLCVDGLTEKHGWACWCVQSNIYTYSSTIKWWTPQHPPTSHTGSRLIPS